MSAKIEGYGVKGESKALDTVILIGGLAALGGVGYMLWKAKQAADKAAGAMNEVVNTAGNILNPPKITLPPYIQEIQLSQLTTPQLTTFKTITAENKGAAAIPETLAAASQLTSELSSNQCGGRAAALNWIDGKPVLECFNVAPQEVTPTSVSVLGVDFATQKCPVGYERPLFGSECIKGETSAAGASVTAVKNWLGSLW